MSGEANALALARFAIGLEYDRIPTEVRHRIKLLVLDAFGCGIYGAGLPWREPLSRSLAELDAGRTCAVWGTPDRLSAPHAALLNGTQVQGYELDDVHRQGVLHLAGVTLPALIALAELRGGLDGRAFLCAAIAAYEIGPRIGLCVGSEHGDQGWHTGSTVGTFASVAGVARALGLDETRTVRAFGIAATQTSGLNAADYAGPVKGMHAGMAAQRGLYAGLLAERGFSGISGTLEGAKGSFFATFSHSTDRFDLKELTAGFGERWETMRDSVKLYACAYTNHTSLDALRAMRARRAFTVEELRGIVVHAAPVTVARLGAPYRPAGTIEAQLNLGFCIATWLLEGEAFVDQFTEEACVDPRRIALAKLVEMKAEEPAAAVAAALGREVRHRVRVEVRLADGTVFEETVTVPRGSEENFPGDDEIVAKFMKLAGRSLSRERSERLCETVLALETLPNVRGLAEMLSA